MRLRHFLKLGLALGAVLTLGGAHAQGFPNKTLNMIVPYTAGGASDFVGRKLQPDAAAALGQTMIVDNVGGAGGTIGLAKMLAGSSRGSLELALVSPFDAAPSPGSPG